MTHYLQQDHAASTAATRTMSVSYRRADEKRLDALAELQHEEEREGESAMGEPWRYTYMLISEMRRGLYQAGRIGIPSGR